MHARLFLTALLISWCSALYSQEIDLAPLAAVYAPGPQDYPQGAEYARPDSSVPFRWHGFHDQAVKRHAKARMLAHVDPYNPIESEGITADKGLGWEFVEEHATSGKKAVRVTFTPADIQAGRALRVHATAGAPSFSSYLKTRGMLPTASAYGPHYRWIKLDVFNPSADKIHVLVQRVPFILHPGQNVVAVKTADAIDRGYGCDLRHLTLQVRGPERATTLFVDHVRMEQEKPAVLSERGWMLQFPGRADAKDPPVLRPVEAQTIYTPELRYGWTAPSKKRVNHGHSFRSFENGILWGHCSAADAPLRLDVTPGRHGILVFGAPTGNGFSWDKGLMFKVNGREHTLLAPRSKEEVRRVALGGETWDYRPGSCVWEELVREPYYPPMQIVYENAEQGRLDLEFPPYLALHALFVFPEKEREAACQELGRFNFLMAESWDVSHPWIRASYAARTGDGHPYMGLHAEMQQPETIPGRLRALKLTAPDQQRGFVPFQRGLTEPVYPDTIPTFEETSKVELRCFAAPGQRECVTVGLLPLKHVADLSIAVNDLTSSNKSIVSRKHIDVRIGRFHQKTMQFGHHNHDYNYGEHYLIRRPHFDLHPGCARRVYVDISVPAETAPGTYQGRLSITGKEVVSIPIVVEVLPLRLEESPVYFASSFNDSRLKDYGFNTFSTSYDEALRHGYKGFLANCGYGGIAVKGKTLHWSHFAGNEAVLQPLIEAGRDGRGPRGFFGGPAPGTHSNPKAAIVANEFFASMRAKFPRIDLPGRTTPVFHLGRSAGLQYPHEWIWLAAPPRNGTPEALEAARKSGEEFWFIDGLRHAKEHAGRFTFGFWLWRLGATGRFTTLEAHLQYGGGTARATYPWEPYFTLLDVTTCNVDRALKDSLEEGVVNPCRDLLLLRAGIDDYRYLHTLDSQLARVSKLRPDAPALAVAAKFRAELFADLSLDLLTYYEARAGAYGENWFPLADNPWTGAKFARTRRQIAEHILALAKVS